MIATEKRNFGPKAILSFHRLVHSVPGKDSKMDIRATNFSMAALKEELTFRMKTRSFVDMGTQRP